MNPEVAETLVGLLSMILVIGVVYVVWLIIESGR